MNEIICPNCKKVFKVDEAGFADILKQVRDHQFEEELKKRLALADREKADAVKLAEANHKSQLQEQISKKDKEIADLKAHNDKAETEKKLSIVEAVQKIEKEKDRLDNELKHKDTEIQLLEKSLNEKHLASLKQRKGLSKLKKEKMAFEKNRN